MDTAILLFKQYSGQGMIVALFLVALAYLWFVEKEKEKRHLLVHFPIFLLIFFFCPIVVLVMEKLGEEEVYWRMLWSIPMLTVIAYTAIILVRKTEGLMRYLAIAGVLLLIMVSGKYLYNNPGFLKAENAEHIPEKVMELCDAVIVEGREVRAAFPSEFLMYVTQYTPLVHMPYGREMFLKVDGAGNYWNDLHTLMEFEEEIDVQRLSDLLRLQGCHYVILRDDKVLSGDLEEYDWAEYYSTEGYVIYIDKNNDPHGM